MTIEEILAGESKNVEFKENLPEKSIKYMKSVVAFANGTGGKIIFGIADKTREVVGFDKEDVFKKMDAIANAVAFDLGVYYQRKLSWSANSYWAIGLQASNFGTKIDYGYGKYDQPAKVSVGGMICHVFGEKHCLQGLSLIHI